MSRRRGYKRYSPEFKREALKRAGEDGMTDKQVCDDFRNLLDEHGIQCSMSARENCYDNAVVESFFGLLKRGRVNRARFRTRDEARAAVFDYIECFYNRKRRHGYLGYLSPEAFEIQTVGLS